jgi:hypothetical protein
MRRLVEITAVALRVSSVLVALTALSSAGRAAADEAPRIDVEVGQTAERDVGIAIGLHCDDLSIIRAELRTESSESNVLRVTGVQPGDTRCRAGTVPGRPMFVFEIHVTARPTAAP